MLVRGDHADDSVAALTTSGLPPFQYVLLQAAKSLRMSGVAEVHAHALMKLVEAQDAQKHWIGYGTLHRALTQLRERGYLLSRWEDPELAKADTRPRRRLYAITAEGERALSRVPAPALGAAPAPGGENVS